MTWFVLRTIFKENGSGISALANNNIFGLLIEEMKKQFDGGYNKLMSLRRS